MKTKKIAAKKPKAVQCIRQQEDVPVKLKPNGKKFITGVDGETINMKTIKQGQKLMEKCSDSIKIRELGNSLKSYFRNINDFDDGGKRSRTVKSGSDSVLTVKRNITDMEFEEICEHISDYIVSNGINAEVFSKMMKMQLELNEIKRK